MPRARRVAIISIFAALSLVPFGLAARLVSYAALIPRVAGTVPATMVPVTVTVFGRSADTISARIAFYRPDGTLISSVERSWQGWELAIDCVVVATPARYLVFPFSVLTEKSISRRGNGSLVRQYADDRVPSIYDDPALSSTERATIERVFAIVRTERWIPAVFGTLRHARLSIRDFEPNVEYSLRVSSGGKLSLVR